MAEGKVLTGADPFASRRRKMVDRDILRRGITDERILEAMGRVPRHLFVPPGRRSEAYADHALPIGGGQTISQPYIVARMIDLAELGREARVLDVGTGCGYAAAVIAEIAAEVVTVEIRPDLAAEAEERLSSLGYTKIVTRTGDARRMDLGVFDAIVVAAVASQAPQTLVDQLADGGRLVIPLGDNGSQRLWVIRRRGDETTSHAHEAVAFVPLIES